MNDGGLQQDGEEVFVTDELCYLVNSIFQLLVLLAHHHQAHKECPHSFTHQLKDSGQQLHLVSISSCRSPGVEQAARTNLPRVLGRLDAEAAVNEG
ncbi:UNVERIFIED_CONTAM: hypothetical protein K2H54_049357 [Gekko kuhli]